MSTLTVPVRAIAGLLVVVTALSVIHSNEWWVRIWDFPRLQILGLLIIVSGLSLWTDRAFGRWVAASCALAAAWQLYRIYPYTPLAEPEIVLAAGPSPRSEQCFRVMSLNVKQSNRNFPATARLIDIVQPDILLLMETDQRWVDALRDQLQSYPHLVAQPLDNTYGMVLASKLQMRDHQIMTGHDRTPVISADLVAAMPFRIVALHPRPPTPGQDTNARDAEIARAAVWAARAKLPMLAIGDFNDVAWSRTSKLFKRVGGYLDPRIGRGTYATFPAGFPLLGWPLDHLFVTPQFSVRALEVLDDIGSDHLPVSATLCLAGSGVRESLPHSATIEKRKKVRETIKAAEPPDVH